MRRVMAIILLGVFAIFAFNMPDFYGSQSNSLTTELAQKYYDFMVSKNLDVYSVKDLNLVFRKLMHFSIYSMISIMATLFMQKLSKRWWVAFLTAPVIAVGIAITDEKLQTMVPGRSGMLMDVMLDSLGVAFGLLVMLIVSVTIDTKKN